MFTRLSFTSLIYFIIYKNWKTSLLVYQFIMHFSTVLITLSITVSLVDEFPLLSLLLSCCLLFPDTLHSKDADDKIMIMIIMIMMMI